MVEPVKDVQTVTPVGESVQPLLDGVSLWEIKTHVDERGSLFELFDERWGWSKEPLVYSYVCTVRPGITKGWGFHLEHEDRYAILFGDVEVVLYDERSDSSTKGQVCKVVLSESRRQLLNIPAQVWHAVRNLGGRDAVLVNFPTKLFQHENPDKYRLPLNNDRIPHKFDGARGW